MAGDGKVNGHTPPRIMARVLGGPGAVAAPGAGDIPESTAEAVDSVTALRAEIPEDAHTAEMLGAERGGGAIPIDDSGLVLTIGYLMLECRRLEVADADKDWVEADFVGYDFETGFGLARAKRPLGLEPLPFGDSAALREGDEVTVAGGGGRARAMRVEIVSRRGFAGYWEYLLEDALFTAPAYPDWSGAAMIGRDGRLLGVGSLLVEDAGPGGAERQGNMFVPLQLLAPILDQMVEAGRVRRRPRPWLGVFTAEAHGNLVVAHTAEGGPAARAGIEPGDVIVRVAKEPVADLGDLYRRMWRVGPAGAAIPLTIVRGGAAVELSVRSADRYAHFRTPRE